MVYPTQKDIEQHINQFATGLRQYFLLGDKKSRIDLVKNDLRCLFTDLLLAHHNQQTVVYGEINFEKFLVNLSRAEHKIIGRQHRIHFYTGKGEILCGVKKWECSDTNAENVECKFCLKKLKHTHKTDTKSGGEDGK